MAGYPSGTVAFLFTDIEESTALWERDRAAMQQALERYLTQLRETASGEGGVLFKTVGAGAQAAFPAVPAAVATAVAAQQTLRETDWGALGPLRVRMAIHVGEAVPSDGDYLAPALNRLARVLGASHGGQVLLTEAARILALPALPRDHALRDLGVHRLRDLLVAEHIYQLTGPGLLDQFPPLRSLDLQPNNLPPQPTELIGREPDLEQVRALLLAPGTRLVTLTGPGGTGKTRLAVQAAADVLESFPDGVWWVSLATMTDAALAPEAIAAALGVREQPGQPMLMTLGEHLRSRRTLLVLDNMEQVLAAGSDLAQLLETAPDLIVLATSREPLRLRGEREIPIAPLPLPAPSTRLTVEAALASPAVRLFVARAQAVKPQFALTAENAAAVVAICQRLDGLPLAIELAAARVRLLTPAALLGRLGRRLALLTGGARDLPERQQTLRAAIDWSYDLLAPLERSLFARLAVFTGGCTFDAAAAVADAGSGSGVDVLDGLDGLVQKSLLRQSAGLQEEPRFVMLETIREYALEQLAAQPEEEAAVRAAHAAFFQRLVDAVVHSADQTSAYDQLEIEAANVRVALDWLENDPTSWSALDFAADLRWFWWVRGHLAEGQARLETVLRKCADAPPLLRAKGLSGLGALLEAGGAYDRARTLYEQALALAREAQDDGGVAEALDNLGTIALIDGDLERAETLRDEALTLRRASGDKRGIAVSLNNLGQVAALEQQVERAIALFEEARDLSLATGDQWILATSLGNLGGALHRRARDPDDSSTDDAAAAALDARATELLRQALAIWRDLGDREGILDCLLALAEIATAGDPARAAMLLGAAEALAEATGYQLAPSEPERYQNLLSAIQATLDAEAFVAARRAGAGLSLDEAIAAAFAVREGG
jgi:predicted ATPase/class 3 adenylate cyclase